MNNYDFSKIKIEIDNGIGQIILNSPESLNLIEKETFSEINEALNIFEYSDAKIILISAICGLSKKGEKIFSAGVNLKKYDEKFELAAISPERFKGELKASRSLLLKIEKYSKVIIIAIDGFVTGGFFELALACDMVLVSESASMSLNEVNIGLIPGYGGIHKLCRLIGKNRAMEIILTGRKISAKESMDIGIASRMFKNRSFNKKVQEFCLEFSEKSSVSLFLIKKTIREIFEGNATEKLEIDNFYKAICSNQAQNAINKFIEKNNT